MLDPIADLEFFEDLHRYRYKGRWMPFSVSKIASPSDPAAERRFEETRHIWEPRDNAVHTYCETLLKGGILWKDEFKDWTWDRSRPECQEEDRPNVGSAICVEKWLLQRGDS